MVIIGGGYIACEFASIFNGFGTEVTIVYRGDRILRGFDYDIRESIETLSISYPIETWTIILFKIFNTVLSCYKYV